MGLVAQLVLPYRLAEDNKSDPRILPWRELEAGCWPSRGDRAEGFRGQHVEAAYWETPLIAYQDLWLAHGRIPDRQLAGAVRRVCWEGKPMVEYRWNELLEAMWWALNWSR